MLAKMEPFDNGFDREEIVALTIYLPSIPENLCQRKAITKERYNLIR